MGSRHLPSSSRRACKNARISEPSRKPTRIISMVLNVFFFSMSSSFLSSLPITLFCCRNDRQGESVAAPNCRMIALLSQDDLYKKGWHAPVVVKLLLLIAVSLHSL